MYFTLTDLLQFHRWNISVHPKVLNLDLLPYEENAKMDYLK